MGEDSTKTGKMSKRFGQLKKSFQFGCPSTVTSHSRSSSSPPFVIRSGNPAPSVTMTPEKVAKLQAKYIHFCILFIGRAYARKMMLIKSFCSSNEDPICNSIKPTKKQGVHDVCNEFIFHSLPGFEAGNEKELEDVLSFIQEKAKSKEVMDQIHTIWLCFKLDVFHSLLELESMFFNKQQAGNVLAMLIFTKFDVLIIQVYDRNKDEKKNLKIANATLEKFEKPLRYSNYPLHAYVCFDSIDEDEDNHQEQVRELIKQTTASSDSLALNMLFVTIQQNNLEVCIEYAIKENDSIFEVFYGSILIWTLL